MPLPAVPDATGEVLDADAAVGASGPAATSVTGQPVLITTTGPASDLEEITQ